MQPMQIMIRSNGGPMQQDVFNLMFGPGFSQGGPGYQQMPQRQALSLGDFLTLLLRPNGEGLDSFFESLGVRPPDQGFKKEDLDKNFFTAKFDKSKSAGLDEENVKCAICLSEF
eukprot:CAMPEP_0176453948 /NCGR_PEP_ID=MMETSP0127-20121128/29580_1 /TAXON_ID=938130 /ORGANISM="Platyophrya macrostoma, Strain WH" /LENGTH=113 /DNA_ID=CAMNT_0017842981 /DNA_START=1 /DNA_END=339 /DNA_ORIENTATION=-